MKFTNKNVIDDNNPLLREKATPVEFPMSEEEIATYRGLREYVINSIDPVLAENFGLSPAVGIAAPQVGVLKQMAAVYIADENDKPLLDIVLINPKIMAHSVEKTYLDSGEACLSVKGIHDGIVERYAYIKVRYQTLDGETKTLEASDFFAVAIQHEMDHLKGILFYDHINKQNPFLASKGSYEL